MSSTRPSHFCGVLYALIAFCIPAEASWQIRHVAEGGIASIPAESNFAIPFPSAFHDESQFLVWNTHDDTVISADLSRNDLYMDMNKREYYGYLANSVCAYRYRSADGKEANTRYLVNYKKFTDRTRRQIVHVDLSLAELRAKSTEMTNRRIEPMDICAFARPEGLRFSAVWHISNDFLLHFIIELNTFDRILENDRRYGAENYFPDVLQTFLSNNQTTWALAVWRKGFGEKYFVRYGSSLKQIENNFEGDKQRFRVHRASAVNPRHGDRFYTIVWKDSRFAWGKKEIPAYFDIATQHHRSLAFLRSEIEEKIRSENIPSLQITVLDSSTTSTISSGVFGFSNIAERFSANNVNIYRIASISKVVTAMCVVRLLSNGRLRSLNERVFGPGGILGYEYNDVNTHAFLQMITVEQLLEHTSGGWGNVERLEEERRNDSPAQFLRWAIGNYRPVAWPGSQFYYSNIGYMILGRVIERLSGSSYEQFAQREVLVPLGIYARLGHQRKDDALWNEVQYYSQDNANPYFNWNPQRMSAAAGWVMTSEQMARLLSDIARRSRTTYSAIVTPSRKAFYGRGIQLRPKDGAIFHCGSLAGTEALVYNNRGVTVAMVINLRGAKENALTPWMTELAEKITRSAGTKS